MKLIAVRLPDEVAAAVESEAVKQERSKSAVVVRALRQVLNVPTESAGQKFRREVIGQAVKELESPEFAAHAKKISEKPLKRKSCQHGDDPLTCRMPACRQARNT